MRTGNIESRNEESRLNWQWIIASVSPNGYRAVNMTNSEKSPDPIPEEVQLAIKLEGIFLPHIRRRREDADASRRETHKAQSSDVQFRCAHYTSAEGAFKIIRSKRIWMRNTTCMSDYREVQHGFGIVQKFFSDVKKRVSFNAAMDACAKGAGEQAIKLFDQWWSNTQVDTFITSMSEHDSTEDLHGRLSMWRAFGGNTARVAIVFNVPRQSPGARALNLVFSPVVYLREEEAHCEIDRAIANIKANAEFLRTVKPDVILGSAFYMLISNVLCLKHEGFREEREWRAIYAPHRAPSPFMESSTEVIAGIPQRIYKMPLDVTKNHVLQDLDFPRLFDRLIIGPSPYTLVMYQAFVAELGKAGVSEPEKRVFISNIPIRTS